MSSRRPVTALVSATAVVLALVGCSSDEQSAESASAPINASTTVAATAAPEATAEVTPEPTPTAMSIEEAGDYYLEHVAVANAAISAINDAYMSGAPDAEVRALAAECVEADRAFADALVAADWPETVQSTVDALIGELADGIQAFQNISESTTHEGLVAAWNSFPESPGNGQKIRILLGIPNAS